MHRLMSVRTGLAGLVLAGAALGVMRPAAAQYTRCPPDMGALQNLAAQVDDAALRQQLEALVNAPLEQSVAEGGGLSGFRDRLQFLQRQALRSPAVTGNVHDRDRLRQIIGRLSEYAVCGHDRTDPRQLIPRAVAGFPASAVGIIQKLGGWGTGVLVGPCLALTNVHVLTGGGVLDIGPGDGAALFLGIGKVKGGFAEWVPGKVVALGPWRQSRRVADDWGLLRLDRPVGETYGYLDAEAREAVTDLPVWTMGFPGDSVILSGGFSTLSSERGCRLLGLRDEAWELSCRSSPGQSGSPVLSVSPEGTPRLLALISAHRGMRRPPGSVSDPTRQVDGLAVPAGHFASALAQARQVACPREPPAHVPEGMGVH
jgi:V8-like Glu-specific endopeptidase